MHSCYQDTHCTRSKQFRRKFGDLLRHIQISEAKFCPTSLRSNRIKLLELEQLCQILFGTYLTLHGSGCLAGRGCLPGRGVSAWPGMSAWAGVSAWARVSACGGCPPRVSAQGVVLPREVLSGGVSTRSDRLFDTRL